MPKRIFAITLAAAMLFSTACGNNDSANDIKTEDNVISQINDSDDDKVTTTVKNSSDRSEDESSEVATTAQDSSSEQDPENTTVSDNQIEQDSTTSASSSGATTTTKQAAGSQPAPVYTTKATAAATKATTKATTKAATTTTKATTKANTSQSKPAGMTRLEDAVWELSFFGNDENTKYLEIVREELIKYGQEYCKKNEKLKGYEVNSKLYPYYDKNGKPLYAPSDMKGNVIAVGSDVEFPYDEHNKPFNYKTAEERLINCRAFINRMYLYIERVLCNSMRHGMVNMQWYITYGFEVAGTCWTVMSGFPDAWGKSGVWF